MKILHVVPTYYPAVRYGGPIRSVHGLASALAAQGHDVHVYTTNVDGDGVSPVALDQPTRLDGVTVWYFATGVGRRLYRSPSMRRALHANIANFNVVHLHSVFLWPTTAAAHVARKAGVPYVVSPRGMLVENLIRRKSSLTKRIWIKLFEWRNIERAAVVHVTSEIEASELEALGFPHARLIVVPNGIEIPSNLSNGGFGSRRPYVLFLGRLNWKKGLDRLIPAMAQVADAELVIAGNDEDNYRQELEALAHRFGLVDRVRLIGPVNDDQKWALLASARILVLPSYSENFGNVVLEAMAASCPVIVTPEVGAASIVREVGCGVVAAGDPANLALAMSRLLNDHQGCQNMGALGLRAVKTKYSWKTIGKEMLDAYADILVGRDATSLNAQSTTLRAAS
jgi:glycosyltransferase involved in cell wall biosynthesis